MVSKYIIRFIAIIIPFLVSLNAQAQKEIYINLSDIFPLNDFQLSNESSLKIKALDKNGLVDKSIEGKYKFIINGYIEKIDFKNGEASLPSNVTESSILYIKHEKGTGVIQHLYYQIAGFVLQIPFYILWLIPLIIIALALIIKRIVMMFLVIGVIVFFIAQGLALSDYIALIQESILNMLK